jgi:RNA polymerase sigma-32 factor
MAHLDRTYQSQSAERRFFRDSINAPLLTRDHEHELAVRWREQEDESALHEITFAYTRLVISMAKRFRNYGLPVADLIQEGSVGLLQAAARFEPERGVRFSTYASWWIRAAMQDFVLRNWSIVRTGTTAAQKSLFFNFRRLRAKIGAADGPLPRAGREKIAAELNVRLQDVEMMEGRLTASDQSLNAPIGENGENERQDFLIDSRPLPEEIVFRNVDSRSRRTWLHEALRTLSERERTIIDKRRLSEDSVTLAELGRDFGISKERVRQIEHKALEKLRTLMACRVERPGDLMLE